MSDFSMLFSPFQIGPMEVRNRIVLPAMETHLGDADGAVTDEIISYYRARALGGAGYITVENTGIHPNGRVNGGMIMISDDKFVPEFSRLADAVHEAGSKILVQLSHAGRQTLSMFTGGEIVAPSAIPCPVMREEPRELPTQEVKEMVQAFAAGAVRVHRAGMDGVEIHMAHGYLGCQFLSPYSNKRTDEYGGSTENRCRFSVEIVKSIRERLGEEFPIVCRISADEFVDEGLKLEESKKIAQILEAAGASAIHVSACNYESAFYNIPCYYIEEGCFAHLAAGIKEVVNVPVIAVGRIRRPEMAEEILQSGKADFVAMGRALIADPELPNKAKDGRLDDIRPCLSCNRCIERVASDKMKCVVNPEVGIEDQCRNGKAENAKKVAIIGGGPAGMESACNAAARGHDVTLIEQDEALGGQLRLASLAPGKGPMLEFVNYMRSRAEKSGQIKLSQTVTADMIREMAPEVVIDATGSHPASPPIPGAESREMLNIKQAFLEPERIGKKVVIIGGGPEGCELADFLNDRGHEVTIVEMKRKVALGIPPAIRFHLEKRLAENGVRVLTRKKVLEIGADGIVIGRKEPEETISDFDTLVCAFEHEVDGRLAEELRKTYPDLAVIGDAAAPRTTLEAIEDGARTGRTI